MSDDTFTLATPIGRSAAEVFAWHAQPGALARLCPPWERVELCSSTGGIRDGARVVIRGKVGPFWSQWEVEHRDYIAGRQFRDVLAKGPFAKWEHLHAITPDGPNASILTDTITYRLPLGGLGRIVAGGFTRIKLARMFAWRHAVTKADLETTGRYGAVSKWRILVAGSSGLVGRALVPFLQTQGHEVIRLVRRSPRDASEVFWDPSKGELDAAKIAEVDAVVNLAGENVAAGRWSAVRREGILRSRVDATRTLVTTMAKLARKPAVLVNASAVGIYGDRGEVQLNEESRMGHGFLPEVALVWETHAEGAARSGIRTALLRFGVVLSPAGGALAKMLPVFRMGLGGPMGAGEQWLSWVSIDDAIGAIYHALLDPRCRGPVNVTSPGAVTNAEFSAVLAETLHRPACLPVPAALLKFLFGQMAEETILASTRAAPARLLATGYEFLHPTLAGALGHVLGRRG